MASRAPWVGPGLARAAGSDDAWLRRCSKLLVSNRAAVGVLRRCSSVPVAPAMKVSEQWRALRKTLGKRPLGQAEVKMQMRWQA